MWCHFGTHNVFQLLCRLRFAPVGPSDPCHRQGDGHRRGGSQSSVAQWPLEVQWLYQLRRILGGPHRQGLFRRLLQTTLRPTLCGGFMLVRPRFRACRSRWPFLGRDAPALAREASSALIARPRRHAPTPVGSTLSHGRPCSRPLRGTVLRCVARSRFLSARAWMPVSSPSCIVVLSFVTKVATASRRVRRGQQGCARPVCTAPAS